MTDRTMLTNYSYDASQRDGEERCADSSNEATVSIGASSHRTTGSWNSIGLEDIFLSPSGRKKHSARKTITRDATLPAGDGFDCCEYNSSCQEQMPREIAIYTDANAVPDEEHDQQGSPIQEQQHCKGSSGTVRATSLGNDNFDGDCEKIFIPRALGYGDRKLSDETSDCECTEDMTCSTDLEQSYTDRSRVHQHEASSYTLNVLPPLPATPVDDLLEIVSLATVSTKDDDHHQLGRGKSGRQQKQSSTRVGRSQSRRDCSRVGMPEKHQRHLIQPRSLSPRHSRMVKKLDNFIQAVPRDRHERSVSGRTRSTAASIISSASSKRVKFETDNLCCSGRRTSSDLSRIDKSRTHACIDNRDHSSRTERSSGNRSSSGIKERRGRSISRDTRSRRTQSCNLNPQSKGRTQQRHSSKRVSPTEGRSKSLDRRRSLQSYEKMERADRCRSSAKSSSAHNAPRNDRHDHSILRGCRTCDKSRASSRKCSHRKLSEHHQSSRHKRSPSSKSTRCSRSDRCSERKRREDRPPLHSHARLVQSDGIAGFLNLSKSASSGADWSFLSSADETPRAVPADVNVQDIFQVAGITGQQIAILHRMGLGICSQK